MASTILDPATTTLAHVEKFFASWLGKPGIPSTALRIPSQLPPPLAALYSLAQKWPCKKTSETRGVFGSRDLLRSPVNLSFDESKIVFLDEKEGGYRCATEREGGRVWVDMEGGWDLVEDDLTRFLVTYALRELLFSSRHWIRGEDLERAFARRGLDILWPESPFVSRTCEFFVLKPSGLVMLDREGSEGSQGWLGSAEEALVRAYREYAEESSFGS